MKNFIEDISLRNGQFKNGVVKCVNGYVEVRSYEKVQKLDGSFRYKICLANGVVGKFDTKREIEKVAILNYEYDDIDTERVLNSECNMEFYFGKFNRKTDCKSTHGYAWISQRTGHVCIIKFLWDLKDPKVGDEMSVMGGFYGTDDDGFTVFAARMAKIVNVVKFSK